MANKPYKLVLTPRAENSLESITDYYLQEHSAERAIKVVQSIEDAFGLVLKSPDSYPVCFDIEAPVTNIRQIIVHHTFKIIYRINKDRIEIIEIFHGKRNPGLIKNMGA